jgi:hypothetical protein
MRVIALIIVISMTFAIVLTQARPILAKPTLFGIGLAHLVALMAEGCGPVGIGATGEAGTGVTVSSIGARFGNGRHRRPGYSDLGLCFVSHSDCRVAPGAERSTAGCAQSSIVERSSSREGSSYRCPRGFQRYSGPVSQPGTVREKYALRVTHAEYTSSPIMDWSDVSAY